MPKKQFRLHSQLTEKQVEADVATYFGWITPDGALPFRLLDIDEQVFGADKHYDCLIPIYMQFKVSQGLTPLNGNTNGSTPLQSIRKYRKENNLFDKPTLYFKLHEKANTATDFQHNILKKFSNGLTSHAFYVAPLALSKKEYDDMLYISKERYLLDPFYFRRHDEIHYRDLELNVSHIPFLRGHVSIIPHVDVTTANHYYSFSTTGTEIAWHSPETIPDYPNRLSDRLRYIFSYAFRSPEAWISFEEHFATTRKIANEIGLELTPVDNPYLNLTFFGRELYIKYGIRQFLMVAERETLKKKLRYNE